jgi:uncharacterized membrane protein HdeD (DUF308 family)
MSLSGSSFGSKVSGALRQSFHEHWRLFLAEGIILSILGIAAMLLPVLAGLATTIFLGWLFLIAGFVGLLFTFRAKGAPGFGWSLLSAVVALVAGALLLWNPLRGLVTLTYVLVAFFIFDGVLIILLALSHRRELSRRWEWMLVNGIIDLILAGIVISGMPGTLVWALGLIVGIDMIFGGASLIAMAMEARKEALP